VNLLTYLMFFYFSFFLISFTGPFKQNPNTDSQRVVVKALVHAQDNAAQQSCPDMAHVVVANTGEENNRADETHQQDLIRPEDAVEERPASGDPAVPVRGTQAPTPAVQPEQNPQQANLGTGDEESLRLKTLHVQDASGKLKYIIVKKT